MKRMLSVVVAIAGLGLGMSSGGIDPEKSKVAVVRAGEVFRVIYEGPSTSMVRMTITDPEGNRIFSESILGQRFVRPYNFSRLPKGDYKLRVEDENGQHQKEIRYEDQVAPEKSWAAHITRLKTAGKYMLTIPYHGNCEVDVRVYDSSQRLVFSELHTINSDFATIYHLKNLTGATIRLVNRSTGLERIHR